MPTANERRFGSKVDVWLICLVGALLLIPTSSALLGDDPLGLPLVIVAVVSGFLLWFLARTYYVVTPTTLLVRSGPLRWRIRTASIRSVRPTRNPLSSPALSLDRLEVRHDSGFILLSPSDKAGFIEAIRAVTPISEANETWSEARGHASKVPGLDTTSVVWLIVGIQVVVAGLVGAVFYFGTRPPAVAIAPDRLTISGGMHTRTVRRADVIDISLIDTLPAARKRSGFGGGAFERGVFDVNSLGRADLFIKRGVPPYLLIRSASPVSPPFIVINFPAANQTREMFARLEAWRR